MSVLPAESNHVGALNMGHEGLKSFPPLKQGDRVIIQRLLSPNTGDGIHPRLVSDAAFFLQYSRRDFSKGARQLLALALGSKDARNDLNHLKFLPCFWGFSILMMDDLQYKTRG